MLMFDACPRCKGTVARIEELNDAYYSCLQCGLLAYTWPPRVTITPPTAA
jgi:hypothetical protein